MDPINVYDKRISIFKKILIGIAIAVSLLISIGMAASGEEFSIYSFFFLLMLTALFLFPIYLIGVGAYRYFSSRKSIQKTDAAQTAFCSRARLAEQLGHYNVFVPCDELEEQAISLAKQLLFADDPEDQPPYEGEPLHGRFSHIIHSNYRGTVTFGSVKLEHGKLLIDMQIPFTNTIYDGEKIYKEEQTIALQMYPVLDFPVRETTEFHLEHARYDENQNPVTPENDRPSIPAEHWMVTSISQKLPRKTSRNGQ